MCIMRLSRTTNYASAYKNFWVSQHPEMAEKLDVLLWIHLGAWKLIPFPFLFGRTSAFDQGARAPQAKSDG
ncbi:hypothetical protein NITHO_3210014 [Nitrolancea hollandica Lb]|uniref:Uncharacterized protein n=1 Tax=Nitrolancea hollandica Lb TaxID=1129897 RepID=I4EHP4_9BACT|nr:hypothetical protein NITHO_3210014 [Nitrolancea hollandica Lb]